MTVRELLLRRRGLFFVAAPPASAHRNPAHLIKAIELELAALGYVASTRLSERLLRLPAAELQAAQCFLIDQLAAALGADKKHVPLFRRFPHDVPADTTSLWVKKVLLHFYQAAGEPCLFCRQVGTTHVLRPCQHVVCDRCFDGSNYSACPVCEHKVDREQPFFQPEPPARTLFKIGLSTKKEPREEHVPFKLVDLAPSLEEAARQLFGALCERKQALSPDDVDALGCVLGELGEAVLAWLPEKIPLKENIATIFGTLLRRSGSVAFLEKARPHLATATDVLRLLAAYSGSSPALQPQKTRQLVQAGPRWHGALAERIARQPKGTAAAIQMTVRRFPVAKLGRPLRRGVLAILEGLKFEPLMEDMLRHHSLWVWVGSFLHPFEYAAHFPRVALAFAALRKTQLGEDKLAERLIIAREQTSLDPRGSGFVFRTYYGRLERAAATADSAAFTRLLEQRPGELLRRLDHALRLALPQPAAIAELTQAFRDRLPRYATPVLLTLAAHLGARGQRAPVRIYWPKGNIAKGVSEPDRRHPLPDEVTEPLGAVIRHELLRRFAQLPARADFIIDGALESVLVPFNERTASRSAAALPRGSRVALPAGKLLRLFLHWCQPPKGGNTDIDLSIGLYGEQWSYAGTCSYYQLRFCGKRGADIATHSGDLRSAPPPDGASEFVDLDCEAARAEGIRYAVMVVNNYAGLSFSKLERGFAGLMLRSSKEGKHFDPRLVALKFDLQGDNGVYMPMVVDLKEGLLHWLDVYSKGQIAFNNVATSNKDIQRRCPEMMAYFASGTRPMMFELALLHAAARAQNVYLRGAKVQRYCRRAGEKHAAFYERILGEQADALLPALPSFEAPIGAALFRGDLSAPAGSTCYALFREQLTDIIAASDFLSA